MARESVGDDKMLVRFGDGTFDRIDKVSGNRSEFIREAVAAALNGAAPVRKVEKAVRSNGTFPGREDDKLLILELASAKRLTSRQASEALGWVGIRYERAETELMREKRIRFDGGIIVPVLEGVSHE